MNETTNNKVSLQILSNLKESSFSLPIWCGVKGTIYRYHGDWNDPEIEAGMCLYNEWDVQDYLGGAVETENKDIQEIVKDLGDDEVLSMISELTPTGIGETFEQYIDGMTNPASSFADLRQRLENLKKDKEHCFIPEKVLDDAIKHTNIEDNDDFVDTQDRLSEIIPEIIEIVNDEVKSGEFI